jgi:hypothetical protein
MAKSLYTIYVTTPGERPDFRLVQAFLWGDERNVDSEGNAASPASRTWTELTLQLRESPSEWVDIAEYKLHPLTLKVCSENRHIAARTAYLLAKHTGGKVSVTASGLYEQPEVLLSDMGIDFDLQGAFARFHNSPFFKSTLENPYPNLEPAYQHRVSRCSVVWRERIYRLAVHLLRLVYRSRDKSKY